MLRNITLSLLGFGLWTMSGFTWSADKSPQLNSCGEAQKKVVSSNTEITNNASTVPNDERTCLEPNKALPQKHDRSLTALELQREEERLKLLFVDVNTVMETVGHTMDWTANWLDGYFANSDKGLDKAKAWGHVIMGWEPRDGEWGNFPVKFKVRALLPNLKNRVELILSDNEQDDFKTLPYESVRPEAYKSSQRSLGAAVRFLHSSSDNLSTSSRLGWGESQMYARTQFTYREKFLNDKVTFSIQPLLEYYVNDGWGARILFDSGLEVDKTQEIRFNYSLRDLESFDTPEWRSGLYSINAVNDKSAVVLGISVAGVVEPNYAPEFYKLSVRYRRKAIRSWIFLEVEPFIEIQRERFFNTVLMRDEYSDFNRDIGITFRIEAHYGFL